MRVPWARSSDGRPAPDHEVRDATFEPLALSRPLRDLRRDSTVRS